MKRSTVFGHVRGSTESGLRIRQNIPHRRAGDGVMDRIGQKLDAVICEVAAMLWLVRAAVAR